VQRGGFKKCSSGLKPASHILTRFAKSPAPKKFIDGSDKVDSARRRWDSSAEDHFIRNVFAVKGVDACLF
jgi:hypothetical protein